MKKKYLLSIVIVLTVLWSCSNSNKNKTTNNTVQTILDFQEAVKKAKPGDSIILSSGIWKDTELLFEATGTEDKPITLTVEEKGKTILEGASNLKIAGKYLIVSGLVFKNDLW